MSLFNETWARLDKAEKELAEANKRIVNLKAALKAARSDKLLAMDGRWGGKKQHWSKPPSRPHFAENELSENDVKELFKAHDYYDQQAKVVKQENTADLKSAASNGFSVRSRVLAPIAALFRK
jgi:hypothetical protein